MSPLVIPAGSGTFGGKEAPNELQRGAILHQADTKQWRRASPTPIEEVSLQSSPAPQEIEETERGSVSKGREKMPQGTPQRRLANTQRVRASMRQAILSISSTSN
uniref:Uncharacterized protein n=1 Tax=Ascaris lumbricoides TaxID=6252 RepID=A0A0M3HWU3_ASCLU